MRGVTLYKLISSLISIECDTYALFVTLEGRERAGNALRGGKYEEK